MKNILKMHILRLPQIQHVKALQREESSVEQKHHIRSTSQPNLIEKQVKQELGKKTL